MNFLDGYYNDYNTIVDERRASLLSNRNSLKIGHPQFEGLITLLSECIVKGSHYLLGPGVDPCLLDVISPVAIVCDCSQPFMICSL